MAFIPKRIQKLLAENETLRLRNTELEGELGTERSVRDELEAIAKELLEEVASLSAQLELMRKHRFGRRSEKTQADQLELEFEEEEEAAPAPPYLDEAPDEEGEEAKTKKCRKRPNHPGRKPLPEHLEREHIDRLPEPEELACEGCGGDKEVIGEDLLHVLEYVPAHFKVLVYRRPRYACRCGGGCVSQAPPDENRPVARGRYGPGLLAHAVVSKYNDHLPFYRLGQIYRRSGVEIPLSSLCDISRDMARLLKPVVGAMLKEALAWPFVGVDATSIRVRDPTRPRPRIRRASLWILAGPEGAAIVKFGIDESGRVPRETLKLYKGYIQADADAALSALFSGKAKPIRVGCWAHARRKFVEAQLEDPVLAAPILAALRQLYLVEKRAREEALSPEERKARRAEESKPLVDLIFTSAKALEGRLRDKSLLRKAVSYAINAEGELRAYLEDGLLEIDNNRVERGMKHIVTGRKNWLFAGSDAGAEAAAIHYSLMLSCRELGIDPLAYLSDVLSRLTQTPAGELTPRAWKAARSAD